MPPVLFLLLLFFREDLVSFAHGQLQTSILLLTPLLYWDDRDHHHAQLVGQDEVLLTFLPGPVSNLNPLNLCLLNICDYRSEPQHLARQGTSKQVPMIIHSLVWGGLGSRVSKLPLGVQV
jgi:hypothetical protein